jgi:hypothetical protein
VEISNGCICCTMRQDLLDEVTQLARSGRFDYLIVESTGIGEPLQARPAGELWGLELGGLGLGRGGSGGVGPAAACAHGRRGLGNPHWCHCAGIAGVEGAAVWATSLPTLDSCV